jgi:uncharacterized protein YndB with AHSA1/START domain
MDVRPGSEWRFVIDGPDGTECKNRIVYLEVVEPQRLVYDHFGQEGREREKLQTTVTFSRPGHNDRSGHARGLSDSRGAGIRGGKTRSY